MKLMNSFFILIKEKLLKINQQKLVVIFTGIIAVFTLLMWCETRRSVNTAKDFYESTNRPFIIFNNSNVTLDENIQWLNLTFNFKNIGNMPSRNFFLNFIFNFKHKLFELSNVIPDFSSIYPSQTTDYYYQVNDSNFVSLCRDDSLSSISIEIIYAGIDENTQYKTKAFFEPSGREFYKLIDTKWD